MNKLSKLSKRHLVLAVSAAVASLLTACGGEPAPVAQQQVAMRSMSGPPAAMSASTITTFTGPRNNYVITRTATGFSVTDVVGTGGTVTLIEQTSAKFSDITVNLLVGDKSKTISAESLKSLIELYVAFFNRVPDADGLSYWIDQVKAGMTMDQLANNFYNAAIIYSNLTGYSKDMTPAEFVKIIYKNVLGRSGATAPPDADVKYWADQLTSGARTKGSLVTTMLFSAHTFAGDPTWGWVPQLLDNKVSVGSYFAVEQGLNYQSPEESISKTMDIVAKITSSSTALAKALINIRDARLNLSLEVPSATGTGKGSSADCFNADLYKVGVVYRLDMQSTMVATGAVSSYAVEYKSTGNVVFKGNSAVELLATTIYQTGIASNTSSSIKTYMSMNANEAFTYGSSLSVSVPSLGDYTVVSTMTPALHTIFNMTPNQAYSQTYTTKQEAIGSPFPFTVPDTTTTQIETFLGQESVTIPAGTFNTCKMKMENISNKMSTVSYAWVVADKTARGLLAKVEMGDGSVKTVSTKLSISGN